MNVCPWCLYEHIHKTNSGFTEGWNFAKPLKKRYKSAWMTDRFQEVCDVCNESFYSVIIMPDIKSLDDVLQHIVVELI